MEPEARRLSPAGVNAHFVEDKVEHLLFLGDYFSLAGHAEFDCSFLALKVAYGALVEGAGDLVVGQSRLLVGCARHVYLRDFSVQEPILGVREGREAVLHPIFQFDVSYFVVWDRELYFKALAVAYNLGNLLAGAQHHSYLDIGWNIERPACGGFQLAFRDLLLQ